MKSRIWIGIGIAAVVILGIYFLTSSSSSESDGIIVSVKKGEFIVDITTTGELEAKNSVEITGPQSIKNYNIYRITIQSIIDEGTLVKKGDFVASLDPSDLSNMIKEAQLDLEKNESQFIQTQLDTTLELRKSRDELINLAYAVDEKQLIVDQSQYEPPATIRQAEIDYEKAVRSLSQTEENNKIKTQKSIAQMQEVALKRKKSQLKIDGMKEVMQEFTITAPEDGMLIYKKNYNGQALKTGSTVNVWGGLVVATLPDLSVMISTTYVNEVDIRKVKVGQSVEIGLDAFPEKKFTGKVLSVQNVGEQRPNSDAKVFGVSVQVIEKDDLLRPAMTTSNRIITQNKEDVMFIPLEALFNQDDSITYVYKKSGLGTSKQEIQIGESNRNDVEIKLGLNEGDEVYLNRVDGMESSNINLLPELDGKRNPEQLEQRAKAKERTETTNSRKAS